MSESGFLGCFLYYKGTKMRANHNDACEAERADLLFPILQRY